VDWLTVWISQPWQFGYGYDSMNEEVDFVKTLVCDCVFVLCNAFIGLVSDKVLLYIRYV
jgi:hypothetical protein